jgi:hypothetical protein
MGSHSKSMGYGGCSAWIPKESDSEGSDASTEKNSGTKPTSRHPATMRLKLKKRNSAGRLGLKYTNRRQRKISRYLSRRMTALTRRLKGGC